MFSRRYEIMEVLEGWCDCFILFHVWENRNTRPNANPQPENVPAHPTRLSKTFPHDPLPKNPLEHDPNPPALFVCRRTANPDRTPNANPNIPTPTDRTVLHILMLSIIKKSLESTVRSPHICSYAREHQVARHRSKITWLEPGYAPRS